MLTLPLQVDCTYFDYGGERFLLDVNSLSVFSITAATYEIIQLARESTEKEQILQALSPRYSPQEILDELAGLEEAIEIGLLHCGISRGVDGAGEEAQSAMNSTEAMVELKLSDLADKELQGELDRLDRYLIIHILEEELGHDNSELSHAIKILAGRKGRYRVKIWVERQSFLKVYRSAAALGLSNFDVCFTSELSWVDADLEKVKALLAETLAETCEPALAIVRDVIKVVGHQKARVVCSSGCWGRGICGNIFGMCAENEMCGLIRIYLEIGLIHYMKYIKEDVEALRLIMSEDLPGRFTARERGELSKQYFWRNNVIDERYEAMLEFHQSPVQTLLTFKHTCQNKLKGCV